MRLAYLISATFICTLSACGGGGGGGEEPIDPVLPPPAPPPPTEVVLPPGWTKLADMPTPLAHFAGVNIGRKIYLAGGYDQQKATLIYDIDANTWTAGADMAIGTDSMSAVVHNGKMVVFGGEANRIVQTYDPQSNSWQVSQRLPSARFSSVTESLTDGVHLIGGWNYDNNNSFSLASHEVYEWETDLVAPKLLAPLLNARNCASSAVLDQKIVVTGGRAPGIRSHDSTALSATELYLPDLNAWTYGADLPTARACSAFAVLDNKLYVMGGDIPPNKRSRVVERYDPQADSWQAISEMPQPTSAALAISVDHSIYVFGGYISAGESKNVYRYTPGSP